jgi:esterase/lipase superfamily enzyme
VAATGFAVVRVMFITDRQPIAARDGRHEYFGFDRQAAGVAYGRITARVPAEYYKPGAPLPTGITIDTTAKPDSGVSVIQPRNLTDKQFLDAIDAYKAKLLHRTAVRLLLFVHGFDVTFPESVAAAARLAFGLRINALPVVISWPSRGDLFKYFNDEQNIEASIERLRPVVQSLLWNPDVDEVVVIAHSMGCRLVARILSELALMKAPVPKLTRVGFAAADLNEAEARELWPRIEPLPSKGWLFYTSGNDLALEASSIIHSASPIGYSKTRVFTLAAADTVDASAVAPSLRGYGHSYVTDNPLLRDDLRRWIAQGLSAAGRKLVRGNRPLAMFWQLHQ